MGSTDAFLRKYDASGAIQWTNQVGTSVLDENQAVSTDGIGNVFVAGRTNGSLGGPSNGHTDGFVSRYDTAGNLLWTKQLGATADVHYQGVSSDGLGNVYFSGYTFGSLGGTSAGSYDAFVGKYDSAGNLQWLKQFGTSSADHASAVSADGLGNVYISGDTFGNLGGPSAGDSDAFLAKYDSSGALQWVRQMGASSSDGGFGVSADKIGNVFITGVTNNSDPFVSKFDSQGNLLWARQPGPTGASSASATSASADGSGGVYMSGAGNAVVWRYDAGGNLQWTKQIGSIGETSTSVAAAGNGVVYFAGYTNGSLEGSNAGGTDAFVGKYSEPQIIPGDYNADGVVDASDYNFWRSNFGTGNSAADGNADGVVNAADYVVWRNQLTQSAGSGAASVPEPSIAAYLSVAMGLAVLQISKRPTL